MRWMGIVAVVLGPLGMLVGAEEVLAALFHGLSFDHGSGSRAALESAKDSVLVGGLGILAMSIWLLVVGILLLNRRGVTASLIWAVVAILVAIGLGIEAITSQSLIDEITAERRFLYPGYLSDLGRGRLILFALMLVLPVAMLVTGRRRPE